MNLDNRRFVAIENQSGLSSGETVFHYRQTGTQITGSYKGGAIAEGFVVGKQISENSIELLFQCLTTDGVLMAGESRGVITRKADGRLGLSFDWNWLNGGRSGGKSEYIELR